jgi:hypothetical protein
MAEKKASPDYPIHEPLAERWSPYAFADRRVPAAEVRSLFEAARWAPSSYNEQPWRYLVATKDDPEPFQRLLSCLVEGNQIWAQAAPVLALGVVSLRFARNAQDNRAAVHDLGLAAGNLLVEATVRGLFVHQMIGIPRTRPERYTAYLRGSKRGRGWRSAIRESRRAFLLGSESAIWRHDNGSPCVSSSSAGRGRIPHRWCEEVTPHDRWQPTADSSG